MTTTANPPILPTALASHIARAIEAAGGWLGFDAFMALALYTPGLGYYANDSRKFGLMPGSGSDFVTAPELSPRFGQTLARQAAQALEAACRRASASAWPPMATRCSGRPSYRRKCAALCWATRCWTPCR
jgi:hypothetical protein